ncbi:MAG TPA: hypothetical protein VFX59_18870 [Polyangiales bacterium]|nr:hypothetical protein [Polyangiales bacterium]
MVELRQEQQQERAELKRKNTQELREEQQDVTEAKKEANEARAQILKDQSERLRELERRADQLRHKQEQAQGEKAQRLNAALSTIPTQQQAIERDIEALSTVKASNLNRAKDQLDQMLSRMDDTLDRAESNM